MEREAKEREAYEKTGFELYTYFPVSTHWPGWTWGVRKFEAGPAHIWLPTPNISFGLGMGWEADLGSRRPVLRRMGVGGVLEMSAVSGLNMKNGEGFGITMLYPYLYYTTDRGRKLDYSFKLGAGMAFVNGLEELFDSRQEKDNESGNVFSLEGDIIFASPGNWRFQAGAAYRFLVYNSRDIHIVTALIRAGYRF
ncbi:MAG: hypothetical protein PQJ50_03825 [Spirochaetales bacterium]|nr:hypothetical protein [Spirochaetales bacterium]